MTEQWKKVYPAADISVHWFEVSPNYIYSDWNIYLYKFV